MEFSLEMQGAWADPVQLLEHASHLLPLIKNSTHGPGAKIVRLFLSCSQDDSMQLYFALCCCYKQAIYSPSATCIGELRTKPSATHLSRKDWRVFFFPKAIKMPMNNIKICNPFIFSSSHLKSHPLLNEDCFYTGEAIADQFAGVRGGRPTVQGVLARGVHWGRAEVGRVRGAGAAHKLP